MYTIIRFKNRASNIALFTLILISISACRDSNRDKEGILYFSELTVETSYQRDHLSVIFPIPIKRATGTYYAYKGQPYTGKIVDYYFYNGNRKFLGEFDNGDKSGYWQYYFENGDLKSEIRYRNGIIEFEQTYFPDGSLKIDLNSEYGDSTYFRHYYKNGQLKHSKDQLPNHNYLYRTKKYRFDGAIFQCFHQDSVTIIKSAETLMTLDSGRYSEGYKEGVWKHYYKSGQLKSVKNYSSDHFEGSVIEYSEFGRSTLISHYENGRLEGTYKEFYQYGSPKLTAHYLKGELDGKYKEYHENGKISTSGQYLKGRENGRWQDFFDNGQLRWERNYREGMLDNKCRVYYSNGVLQEEGNYYGNRKTGSWKYYDKDGNLLRIVEE